MDSSRHKLTGKTSGPENQAKATENVLTAVTDAIDKLRFGAILLTIHDGKVVQLDVTERHRFS